jgi:hypothetical protein
LTPDIINFDQALAETEGQPRDILLGNGFSIAAHPPFAYGGLLQAAGLGAEVRAIFAAARTANFEAVMRYWLAEAFNGSAATRSDALAKVDLLKRTLVEAVHRVHPARRTAICPERWAHCEQFLTNFIGRVRDRRRLAGRVFTTNYDLLLWWAVTPDRGRRKPDKLFKGHDGFRLDQYEGLGSADLVYLHGALHLFPAGRGIRKLSYSDAKGALHDQVAAHLRAGAYPIFVSEGASTLKRPSDGYLREALTKFGYTANSPDRVLFTLGHGLGLEDDHIFALVRSGKIRKVFLGAYGAQEVEAFKAIAKTWIEAREAAHKPQLSVAIYDTEGLAWGPPANSR